MRVPRTFLILALAPSLIVAAACGGGGKDAKNEAPATAAAVPQVRQDNPVDKVTLTEPVTLSFWHTQTGPNADKLQAVVDGFNAKNPMIKVQPQFVGNYTDEYKKLLTSISANQFPDIATGYPSQFSEYQAANALVPLDDYITSEKYGFKKEEVADFIDSYLAESRYYPDFGNKYLSFPFTKSLLGLYYNEDKLKEAGQKVPTTWDEFRAVCKAVTKGDTKCLSIDVSASTFDGMLFSRGGKIISDDQKTWQFNQQAGQDVLQMYEDMVKEGTAFRAEKAFADQVDFGAQRTVFTMGSTSGIPFYQKEVAGKFNWSIANLPHAANVQPATVLYGGSITVFKSNPQKQLAAWQFIKYFSSPEVTADWATSSGYMPVRKSALTMKPVLDTIAKFPAYGVAVNQISPTAKPETVVAGTQDTRTFIEDAIVAVLSDPSKSPKAVLDEAQQKGQKALKQ